MIRPPLLLMTALMALCLACTPLRPAGVSVSEHTGTLQAFSAQAVISDHPHHVLVGYVVIRARAGEIRYLVEIGQVNDGVHRRLRMDAAWWRGQRLRFTRLFRTEPYCVGPWDCNGYRTGTLRFTRGEFAQAARDGVSAQLIGPDATIEVAIPAQLFVEAIEQAVGM